MQWIRPLFNASFTLLVLGSLCIFYKKTVQEMVLSPLSSEQVWEPTTFHPSWEELQSTLSLSSSLKRPLVFLGIGSQCIAFMTEDEQYVMKVCKATCYHPPCYLPIFSDSFKTRCLQKEKKKSKDFTSYLLAYDFLPQESGIVFLHLNRTKDLLKTPLTLKDPWGGEHVFPADDLLFYIQKKATLFPTHLQTLVETGQKDKIIPLVREMFLMVQKASAQGIQLKDIKPHKNIGIHQGKPFLIDPGKIKYKDPFSPRIKLQRLCKRLSTLLLPIDPEISRSLEFELDKLLINN